MSNETWMLFRKLEKWQKSSRNYRPGKDDFQIQFVTKLDPLKVTSNHFLKGHVFMSPAELLGFAVTFFDHIGASLQGTCWCWLQEAHPDGFVILGHSIGAWVVLQHLKTRTAEQVHQIPLAVLAMPSLWLSIGFPFGSLISCQTEQVSFPPVCFRVSWKRVIWATEKSQVV